MNKTIEEAAQEYNADANVTSENFCPEDITDAFIDGANHFLSLPLAERLTEEEKKMIRAIYNRQIYTAQDVDRKFTEQCLLESIFGSEFFKEEV